MFCLILRLSRLDFLRLAFPLLGLDLPVLDCVEVDFQVGPDLTLPAEKSGSKSLGIICSTIRCINF